MEVTFNCSGQVSLTSQHLTIAASHGEDGSAKRQVRTLACLAAQLPRPTTARHTWFYVFIYIKPCGATITMTYEAFVAELSRTGLTIREFAEMIGMRPNSITNNRKRGEVPDHLAVIAALLSELRLVGVPVEPVIARLGLSKKRPRGAATPGRFAGDKQGTLELRP